MFLLTTEFFCFGKNPTEIFPGTDVPTVIFRQPSVQYVVPPEICFSTFDVNHYFPASPI
jgi:hypothetical protein